jgi:hypothetical protein
VYFLGIQRLLSYLYVLDIANVRKYYQTKQKKCFFLYLREQKNVLSYDIADYIRKKQTCENISQA